MPRDLCQTSARVRISDELRILRRAGDEAFELPPMPAEAPPEAALSEDVSDPDRADGLSDPAPEAEVEAEVVPGPARPDFPVVRLQRHGLRPLEFRGLPLVSLIATASRAGSPGRAARQSLALYLTDHQDVIASSQTEFEGCGTARPLVRVAPIAGLADLDRFLADCRPAQALLPGAATDGIPDPETGLLCTSLTEAFAELIALCCNSQPAPQQEGHFPCRT